MPVSMPGSGQVSCVENGICTGSELGSALSGMLIRLNMRIQ